MAKKKTAKRPKTKPAASTRDTTAVLLLVEAAKEIGARDCAAFSLMVFSKGEDIPDEWKPAVGPAMQKFLMFGWTAFHVLGGTDTDWQVMFDRLQAQLAAK